jgi:hypothetical protein
LRPLRHPGAKNWEQSSSWELVRRMLRKPEHLGPEAVMIYPSIAVPAEYSTHNIHICHAAFCVTFSQFRTLFFLLILALMIHKQVKEVWKSLLERHLPHLFTISRRKHIIHPNKKKKRYSPETALAMEVKVEQNPSPFASVFAVNSRLGGAELPASGAWYVMPTNWGMVHCFTVCFGTKHTLSVTNYFPALEKKTHLNNESRFHRDRYK